MNPRIKALRQRQDAAKAQANDLIEQAEAEDRILDETEQAQLDDLKAEIKTLDKRCDAISDLYAPPTKTEPVDGLTLTSSTPVTVKEPNSLKDPKKGFASSQEFFRTVMSSTTTGRIDQRLKPLATAGSDEAGTYSDPYGGFLVPAGFMPNLLSLSAEGDPTAGRTMAVPMTSPSVDIPARTDKTHTSSVSGGLIVYRRSETQSVTATRMEMETVGLKATPLMGLSYATEELINDSAISFVALLEAGFRDEFAKKILNEKIRGTGVGQMEGVLSTPALISVTGAGGAAEIIFEDIVQMRSQCYGYQNAIWLYNHDCLPQLAQMVMPIGTAGVAMWQNSARESEPDMLWGRPAFPCEHCASVGTVGDIILGDWSQYLEGTYQQLESAESLHVRFVNNERTFRFLLRNDGKCWWRSALTPAQSSTTLSPFVAIGTRT